MKSHSDVNFSYLKNRVVHFPRRDLYMSRSDNLSEDDSNDSLYHTASKFRIIYDLEVQRNFDLGEEMGRNFSLPNVGI
jgi:hypothetical protein